MRRMLVVAAFAAMLLPVCSSAATPPLGVCLKNDAIARPEREASEKAAMRFQRAFLAPDPRSAYALLSKDMRADIPLATFLATAQSVQVMAPKDGFVVVDTYLVGKRPAGGRSLCGNPADDSRVTVTTAPTVGQAHVKMTGHSLNNDWSFTVRLTPERGGWRVAGFYVVPSAMAGHGPEYLLRAAGEQRARGQPFNAAVLYVAAQTVSGAGPDFRPAIADRIETAMADFQTPPELSGPPPFSWTLGGTPWRIEHVGILGIEGGFMLTLDHTVDPWRGDAAADESNKALAEDFIKAHPEYAEVFGSIGVRAMKPDGSGGFTTVYEVGKGFL